MFGNGTVLQLFAGMWLALITVMALIKYRPMLRPEHNFIAISAQLQIYLALLCSILRMIPRDSNDTAISLLLIISCNAVIICGFGSAMSGSPLKKLFFRGKTKKGKLSLKPDQDANALELSKPRSTLFSSRSPKVVGVVPGVDSSPGIISGASGQKSLNSLGKESEGRLAGATTNATENAAGEVTNFADNAAGEITQLANNTLGAITNLAGNAHESDALEVVALR